MRDIEASGLWAAETKTLTLEKWRFTTPQFERFCFQTDMAQLRSLMALRQFMRSLGENVDDAELV